MAERDYRVTYKSREADPRDSDRYDDPRRRIPTALDPYLYPDDRDELKRNVALAKARASRYDADDSRGYEESIRRETVRDDVSNSTVRDNGRPATTKTTYSVTSGGLEKESEVRTRASMQARESTVASSSPTMSRRTEYRERDDFGGERTSTVAGRSSGRASVRPYDDREYSRMVYDVERPQKENGVYVVDARDADVYVAGGGRDSGRGFAGYRNDVYEDDYRISDSRVAPTRATDYRQSDVVYSSRDDYRSSAPSVNSGSPYMSGAKLERVPTAPRSQTALRGPSRQSTIVVEDDRASRTMNQGLSRQSTRKDEEDFAFVERRDTRAPTIRESFKDPFGSDGAPPETPRGRTRASTFTKSPSEDEYVMVSPPQQRSGTSVRAASQGEALRSSLVSADRYSTEERQQRRRSRSIAFRAHEADDHYAGDRYHQPPGAEAAECGKFLVSYGGGRDKMDFEYDSRNSRRDDRDYGRSRSSRYEEVDYDRQNRGSVRRASQGARSKSRRRRDSDDESYVSKYIEKTKKTSYY